MKKRSRVVITGIAAVLMVATIGAPALARVSIDSDDDEEEPPVFEQLDPNDIDISDVEIFGRDSGPVYGERVAEDVSASFDLLMTGPGPALDPRFGREMDVAEVEVFDPTADQEAPSADQNAPSAEQVEQDLYAEAEALFRSLHENDIDISGVEIYGRDSAPTETAVAEPQARETEQATIINPSVVPSLPPGMQVSEGPALRPAIEPDVTSVQIAEIEPPQRAEAEPTAEAVPVTLPNTLPDTMPDTMDVADVEIFQPEPLEIDEDPKADEVQARQRADEMFANIEGEVPLTPSAESETRMASLRDPTAPLPDYIDRSVPGNNDGASSFDSSAFPGNYAGVGTAGGMTLELESNGPGIHGWLVDSDGQVFTVGGEITTLDGHAQAAVVSDSVAIGYLDMELTNLGLGALYVPLADDMSPIVGDARQYEFLRSMSAEAQAALESEREERLETLAEQNRRNSRGRRAVNEEYDVWE